MDRKSLMLEMCRHADGSVDLERYRVLCNRWSPMARQASLAVRMAKYGSGFSPAARAAAAASARARGGAGGGVKPPVNDKGVIPAGGMEGMHVNMGGSTYTVREGKMIPAAVGLAAEAPGTRQEIGTTRPGTVRDPAAVGRFGDAGLRDATGRVIPGSGDRVDRGIQYQRDPNGGKKPHNPLSTLRQSGGAVTYRQGAGVGGAARVPVERSVKSYDGTVAGASFRKTYEDDGDLLKPAPRYR